MPIQNHLIHRITLSLPNLFLLLVLLTAVASPASAAPKTDIVIFKNGDRLTGEIKSLKRGKLNLNTDATGTIAIEWDKIANIISKQNIQVETSSGRRYFGNLVAAEEQAGVFVDTIYGTESLENYRVVSMQPIEAKRTLDALDVDVMLGYNFAKAGGVKQSTFGLEADYRTRVRIYSVNLGTTVNDSSEQAQSQRSNLDFMYTRLWQDRWYLSGNLSFDRNDELGLDLRSSLGASGGRYVIQSNSMLLDLSGGLQFSREHLQEEMEVQRSIEALFTAKWDWFRFDSPELDWSTSFQLIPNLTDWGRVRANFDTRLRWEIINDLKLGISFYSSYDNKQTEDASGNDYGVNTNVSYEF